MRRTHRTARAGLTLVELMVALAISAMLAGAMLGLVAQLSRGLRTARAAGQDRLRHQGLRRLLETDLASATAYRMGTDRLELRTLVSIDPPSQQLRHLPVEVVWRIDRSDADRLDDPGLLLRVEAVGGTTTKRTRLVGPDVQRIDLRPAGSNQPGRGDWSALPEEAIVTVELAGSETPLQFRHRTRQAP